MINIGDKVVDENGYRGKVTNIFPETGQVQVQQRPNVWCTYDSASQLCKEERRTMSLVGNKFQNKTVLEVVAVTPLGYLVQYDGRPQYRWEISKEIFENEFVMICPADRSEGPSVEPDCLTSVTKYINSKLADLGIQFGPDKLKEAVDEYFGCTPPTQAAGLNGGVPQRYPHGFPHDLTEIIKQLKFCQFRDEIGHPLESNAAFIALEEMAKAEQSKKCCSAQVEKALTSTEVKGTKTQVKDVEFYGDCDTFRLLCKASSQGEGWMKSTKVCNVPGGCVVQVTTQQRNPDGSYACAEALTYVPSVEIDITTEPRRLVAINGERHGQSSTD